MNDALDGTDRDLFERGRDLSETDVAIVGMTLRVPGSDDVETFWENVREGREGIRPLREEEMLAAGVSRETLEDPNFVRAAGVLEHADLFDPAFFGYTPREAAVMDPQRRVMLQGVWDLLERAGYDTARYPGTIGIFVGSGRNTYQMRNLAGRILTGLGSADTVGLLDVFTLNDAETLGMHAAHKLDLRGPCITVQTGCSTSLVAVHMACQALLGGEADMMVAGGVCVRVPQHSGYRFVPGAIISPDGHNRTFDVRAGGSVFGSGMALVLLKRLEDALRDRDCISAVIKGSAANNDGKLRASYTAPGVEGQARVIAEAMSIAGVHSDEISYLEAHGTATPIGDSIEIAALKKAFHRSAKRNACALGAVKSQVGHLDAAAGATGLIKTALMLQHRELVPSLFFEEPNPQLGLEDSPFAVVTERSSWKRNGAPRRAGVSSFGMGGTNAHAVVQEAPARPASDPARPCEILVLSARTDASLSRQRERLARHLEQSGAEVCDVVFTLQIGRREFGHRFALPCGSVEEAIAGLRSEDAGFAAAAETHVRPVSFLVGSDSGEIEAWLDAYDDDPVIESELARCGEIIGGARTGRAVAVFSGAWAIAQQWIAWGLAPNRVAGFGIGHLVASCIAGELTLRDALLGLVSLGSADAGIDSTGSILVATSASQLREQLDPALDVVRVSEGYSSVAGSRELVHAAEGALSLAGIAVSRLSAGLDPAAGGADVSGPRTPSARAGRPRAGTATLLSNLAEASAEPRAWDEEVSARPSVRATAADLAADKEAAVMAIGCGAALAGLVERQIGAIGDGAIFGSTSSLGRSPSDPASSAGEVLARLWVGGVALDWAATHGRRRRHRVVLPTYARECERYWIEPERMPQLTPRTRPTDVASWFFLPGWRRSSGPTPPDESEAPRRWLALVDRSADGDRLVDALRARGHDVVRVAMGSSFLEVDEGSFSCRPGELEDFAELFDRLAARAWSAERITHAWCFREPEADTQSLADRFEAEHRMGLATLLALLRAWLAGGATVAAELQVLSSGLHAVSDDERVAPGRAALLGPLKVLPQEQPHLRCRSVDALPGTRTGAADLTARLADELCSPLSATVVAYRGAQRWVQSYEPTRLEAPTEGGLRQGGVYLITGAFGPVGVAIAKCLAERFEARLALTGRVELPPPTQRGAWLASAPPDDPVAQRLRAIGAIEALGAEVLALTLEVSDASQVRAAVESTVEHYGRLDGVIHMAADTTPNGFSLIDAIDAQILDRNLDPKARGAIALAEALEGRELDFCLLFSSLASVLGGIAYAGYAASNSALDSLADYASRATAQRWLAVNWDNWRIPEGEEKMLGLGGSLASMYMLPDESVECIHRLVGSRGVSRYVQSIGDLDARLSQWIDLNVDLDEDASRSALRQPRPQLQTERVEPETELQRGVVSIWEEIMGIDGIGVQDNFFELGGHSLMAVQTAAKINAAFGHVTVGEIFQLPTVAELAAFVEHARGGA